MPTKLTGEYKKLVRAKLMETEKKDHIALRTQHSFNHSGIHGTVCCALKLNWYSLTAPIPERRNSRKLIFGRNPSGRAFHSNALLWQPAPRLIANRRGSQRHFRFNPLRLSPFGREFFYRVVTRHPPILQDSRSTGYI